MAVSIVPGSAMITHFDPGRVQLPYPEVNMARCLGDPLIVKARVTFQGAPGDSAAGWRVGWIQLLYRQKCWAYYRGQFVNQGSVLIQRAKPPGCSQEISRDTDGPAGTRSFDQPGFHRRPPRTGLTPVLGDNSAGITKIGDPPKGWMLFMLTAPQTQSTWQISSDAGLKVRLQGHPNRHESRQWDQLPYFGARLESAS